MATRKKAAETAADLKEETTEVSTTDKYAALEKELEEEREAKAALIAENKKLSEQNTEIAQRNSEQAELIAVKEEELKAAQRERKAEEDKNSSLKDGGVPCTVAGRYRLTKGKAFKDGVCHTPTDNPTRVFRVGEIIGANWVKA